MIIALATGYLMDRKISEIIIPQDSPPGMISNVLFKNTFLFIQALFLSRFNHSELLDH